LKFFHPLTVGRACTQALREMRQYLAVTSLLTLALTIGCGSDHDDGGTNDAAPSGGTGGSAGTGGTGGIAGAAGTAGTAGTAPKTDRGELADFPEADACVGTCEEACNNIADCDSAGSAFPMDKEQCLGRCELAGDGPIWDDVSGNFRCCASQDSCEDKATCAGWLSHPDTTASCEHLCGCFFGSTVPAAPAGAQAHEGYEFATDTIIYEGADATTLASSAGQEVLFAGRYSGVKYLVPVSARKLAARQTNLRPLPTFRNAAGMLAAATGKIFVRAVPGRLSAVSGVARAHGLHAPLAMKIGKNLHAVNGGDPWQSLAAVHALNELPGVQAELDMVRHYVPLREANDPLFVDQWHLKNTGQNHAMVGVDGRVSEAWDITFGAPEVVIAVYDNGVQTAHPDLAADTMAPLFYPSGAESDAFFGNHGTSVAGVAAGIGDNALGGAGVCPGCKILPAYLSLGIGGGTADAVVANNFRDIVDGGAWVINNSWGPSTGADPRFFNVTFGGVPAVPMVISAAFDYAETSGRDGKGTVILFAAGNDNVSVPYYSGYETNMRIGAVDDQGLKAYYSDWGGIDVGGPSNGGINGITTTGTTGYTDSFGGTSSASPFVAGVAGLVLSANPALTAAEVRSILRDSATKIDEAGGNYDADGISPYYGTGLVNAYTAVQMATGDCIQASDCPPPSDVCSDNCDGAQCDVCRTDADCAADHVCQALPKLGLTACVAKLPDGEQCPAGTTLQSDYCLPDRATCSLCSGSEECNGRDDNCSGAVDEDDTCSDGRAPSCMGGDECSDEEACAGIGCADRCDTDDDCGEGASCDQVKNRYGEALTDKACNENLATGCPAGCEVLASSLEDAARQSFIDCMEDGEVACNSAQACAIQLPIQF
jgi:subtilisin family serine protease